MAKNIVNQKYITQLIAEKKRIKLTNTSILTADVNHIVVKDIIELYLKLNFCTKIDWIDIDGNQLNPSNFFVNLINIIKDFFSVTFYKNKLNKLISAEENLNSKSILNPSDNIKILYLRTDHWFNLKSGGSVGHTSGVINSLIKRNVLNQVLSSSKLFNVKWLDNYILAKPNYCKTVNVPNLPDLTYNIDLINKYFVKEKKLDINLIYQRYSLGNFFGVYLRRKYKLPLVLEFNGSELWVSKNWNNKKVYFFDLLNRIEQLNLKYADKIIVVSEVLKNSLIQNGIAGNKILVNPNGVNTDIYQPHCGGKELKQQLGLTNCNVVGFIGTFGAWHGAIVMAKAIVHYYKNYPNSNTKFLLIGEGNDLPEVKRIIEESGFEDKVIYTGRIDQTEGPRHLDACDILLSPHIPNPDGTDFFGSPTKLFEYMAMGKAIIASNLNQIGEILEHNKTAILVEPNNVEALSNAINNLTLEKKLKEELGTNARLEVIKNYSWDKHVDRILNFVTEQ